jgi:hypothetical protein
MIKKLEDIILRSKQIADLENSDYISPEEFEFMLNEVMDKVYADLINIGDKYYVKTTTSTILPTDFMCLAAVFMNETPVPSKPNSACPGTNYGWFYDLQKDHIEFGTDMHGPVLIEYYPTPEHIYWPTHDVHPDSLDLPSNICFNYFCYSMAMKMKAKQGADFTQIQALAQEQLDAYIQLQHRDQYGVERVNNIYGGRAWQIY